MQFLGEEYNSRKYFGETNNFDESIQFRIEKENKKDMRNNAN